VRRQSVGRRSHAATALFSPFDEIGSDLILVENFR
jgi:hypothetical protein